jgi:hypothetical protein
MKFQLWLAVRLCTVCARYCQNTITQCYGRSPYGRHGVRYMASKLQRLQHNTIKRTPELPTQRSASTSSVRLQHTAESQQAANSKRSTVRTAEPITWDLLSTVLISHSWWRSYRTTARRRHFHQFLCIRRFCCATTATARQYVHGQFSDPL